METHEVSAVLLSLGVASLAVLLSLPFGLWCGWILARKRFPGKTLFEAIVFLPLVLPPIVTGFFLLYVLGPETGLGKLLNIDFLFTWRALVVAAAVVGFPLMVRPIRAAIEDIDQGLEEAARTLGHSRWQTLKLVTLPLARRGILGGSVLAFARALGEFGATVMVASNLPGERTLALEIFNQAAVPGTDELVMRLALISVALSILALVVSELLLARHTRDAR
ncbi:MAG: molybdate ABC transporter permease subunit [Candidatus Eisenbacteria bacterium]|uniref:Molybdenum transport system permease n=1 Tax=Eiseniibacteriota bacterium TaxID=2212470 RepID=A0A7Y2ED69_UNCEI|nr:molybdate ABC transporter permease subunit [Candidatus Eisenbacteria bacterium]